MTPAEARDALEPLRKQLERIADLLQLLIVPEPDPILESTECPHPEDQRADLGTTNGEPEWECKACGFRTHP